MYPSKEVVSEIRRNICLFFRKYRWSVQSALRWSWSPETRSSICLVFLKYSSKEVAPEIRSNIWVFFRKYRWSIKTSIVYASSDKNNMRRSWSPETRNVICLVF